MTFFRPLDGPLVSAGLVSNWSSLNKYGLSTNVDTSTTVVLWDGANSADDLNTITQPTDFRLHSITGSANDTNTSGTGARKVEVFSLVDAGGGVLAYGSEVVNMAGTGGQNTGLAYKRIFRMRVTESGTIGTNDIAIKATAASDATISCMITAGKGSTFHCHYSTANTHELYITSVSAEIIGNATANAQLEMCKTINIDGTVPTTFVLQTGIVTELAPWKPQVFDPPIKIDANSDVWVQALAASGNDTTVSARFSGYLREI